MLRAEVSLPWYQVVRSNRSLAFEEESPSYKKQKERLKKEGVLIVKGKVIPLKSDNDLGLDELLWK